MSLNCCCCCGDFACWRISTTFCHSAIGSLRPSLLCSFFSPLKSHFPSWKALHKIVFMSVLVVRNQWAPSQWWQGQEGPMKSPRDDGDWQEVIVSLANAKEIFSNILFGRADWSLFCLCFVSVSFWFCAATDCKTSECGVLLDLFFILNEHFPWALSKMDVCKKKKKKQQTSHSDAAPSVFKTKATGVGNHPAVQPALCSYFNTTRVNKSVFHFGAILLKLHNVV